MPAVEGQTAGADPEVAFGKFLIDEGMLTKDQVSEAYKLLVGYRKRLPNVNLAQVLARHGMGTKESLRDAYLRFKAQDPSASGARPAGSGIGAPPGSGVGFFPTADNPGSGSFMAPGSGVGPAPGSGVGPAPGSGVGPGPGSGVGGSRFGFKTVELKPNERASGNAIPPTIDPDGATLAGGIPPTIDPDAPSGSGFGAGSGFGPPPGSGFGPPPGSGFGQPAGSGFGQPAGSGFGQPAGSGYGQPAGSGFGQPAGSGFGQPAGSGFGQPAGSGFGQPAGSGFGSGFGSPAGSGFGSGSAIPPTIDPDGATLAGGIPPTIDPDSRTGSQFGSGFGSPAGSAFGSGFGAPAGSGFGSGSAIPPTIDPDSRPGFDENATLVDRPGGGSGSAFGQGVGSAFGQGPGSAFGAPVGSGFGGAGSGFGAPAGSGFGGGPGSNFAAPAAGSGSAFGGGPGSNLGSNFAGGTGSAFGTGFAAGSGPGTGAGSAFGGGPGGSGFGSGLAPGKPKIDLPAPAQVVDHSIEDEEDLSVEEADDGAGPKKKKKKPGSKKKKEKKPHPAIKQQPKLPMGILAGVGVVLVLVVGLIVNNVLSNKRLRREKELFLAAVVDLPPEEALKKGDALPSDLLEDPEIKKALADLGKQVDSRSSRGEADQVLAGLEGTTDLQKRIDLCNKALELDDTFPRAYVERARARYALDKRKALQAEKVDTSRLAAPAMLDLAQALKHDPKSAWSHYVRAEIALENMRNPDYRGRAMRDLEKVRELDPNGALGALAQGRREALKRNFDKALEFYNAAISKDAKLLSAYVARADAWIAKRNFKGALADATQAVELDKTNSLALTLRAAGRFHLRNDRPGALRDLNDALEIDPTQIRALALRSYVRLQRLPNGELKAESAREKEAIKASEKDALQAKRLDDGQFMAHLTLAEIYQTNKNLSKALHHASKAVELSFRFEDAYLVRGRLRVRDGDHDHALTDFEEVLDINPNNARALSNKAAILVNRNDHEQARHLLDQALEIDHKLPQAHFYRGYMNMRARPRNFRKAIEDLSKAIGLDPEFADAYYQRALCHHDIQRFGDCLSDLDKAEALRKKGAEAGVSFSTFELGLLRGHCYYRRQEYEKALKSYKTYVRAAPVGHKALKKIKKRIKEIQEKEQKGG